MQAAATWTGIVFALAAAILWLWASLVEIPPFPDVGFDSESAVFDPIRLAMRKVSRLNAAAAACSALAALAAVIVAVAQRTS